MSRHRQKLSASHQRSWLWGRHAVEETLHSGRWAVIELLIGEELGEMLQAELQSIAEGRQIPVQIVSAQRIQQLTGASDHQGLAARMAEFPYEDPQALADLLHSCMTRQNPQGLQPLFVICDRIQDAHNFGAILRCCDGAAVDGILVADSQQAAVTPHVARSSAGAVNSAHLFRFGRLTEGLQMLKSAGVTVAAASEKSDRGHWDVKRQGAMGLIVGSEAFGVHPELLEQSDLQLRIPMMGRIESLNAAVAAGILLYELRRPLA